MITKAIIFDASTLISFTMNGLFEEIRKLKGVFKGEFLITQEVKREIIDNPIRVRKFQLEALKLKQLLDEKILEMPSSFGINNGEISDKTQETLKIANSSFIGDGKEIHLIDLGEASCLALSRMLEQKRIENVVAIDERTTRMLIEKPENLKELLERRLHVRIKIKEENLKFFKEFKVIRSTELAYVIWKKELINLKNGVLEALLYSLKFNGASISDTEIDEIKNMK